MAIAREEAIAIFWGSSAPEELTFRSASRIFYVAALPPIPPRFEPEEDFDTLNPVLPDELLFYLEAQPFGSDGLYAAVLCNGMVLVPPFPIDQRDNLPSMRPASL